MIIPISGIEDDKTEPRKHKKWTADQHITHEHKVGLCAYRITSMKINTNNGTIKNTSLGNEYNNSGRNPEITQLYSAESFLRS
jgi:hypothetical protein